MNLPVLYSDNLTINAVLYAGIGYGALYYLYPQVPMVIPMSQMQFGLVGAAVLGYLTYPSSS